MSKILFLPGWLNTAENLRTLADMTGGRAIDLPAPDRAWGVVDYAGWVAGQIADPVYIAGHSFGGKIAIAVAARHPEKVRGIFVIAGSNRGRAIFRFLRPAIKIAKFFGLRGGRFQTGDYKNSSPVMKQVMRKTLDFDIIPLARRVKCPAAFIYGSMDATTPPKLGRRLARAVPGARFFELAGFDHHTIAADGAWQVSAVIKSLANDDNSSG